MSICRPLSSRWVRPRARPPGPSALALARPVPKHPTLGVRPPHRSSTGSPKTKPNKNAKHVGRHETTPGRCCAVLPSTGRGQGPPTGREWPVAGVVGGRAGWARPPACHLSTGSQLKAMHLMKSSTRNTNTRSAGAWAHAHPWQTPSPGLVARPFCPPKPLPNTTHRTRFCPSKHRAGRVSQYQRPMSVIGRRKNAVASWPL